MANTPPVGSTTGFCFLIFVTVPHLLQVGISMYALLPVLLNSLHAPLHGALKAGLTTDDAAGCLKNRHWGAAQRMLSPRDLYGTGVGDYEIFVNPVQELRQEFGRAFLLLPP